ncbi:MAG: tRNA (guanine-N(1)-)-methyltransferase [Parcubacteria group bacterium GW2011_GWC2_42_11]|nr:MAG: tRNA (guanine-N(1)-)-methyltransferase [Parcubacteria group bacterium GW2011_GWC2_42_11]
MRKSENTIGSKKITFHIVTLFPGAFDSYFNESIIKRAISEKKIHVQFYNPRDFTDDKWARVDRRPYGGGPGMVLEAESILKAVTKAIGRKDRKYIKIVFFEPEGIQFDTSYADKVSKQYTHVILICGRYEGIDARVKKILRAEAVTVGPYTLTGGELPAMVLLDCITRRLKGVLGKDESIEERRVSASEVYTRPEVLVWKGKKYKVPKVLLSGNHKDIEAWKNSTKILKKEQ